MAVLVPLVWRGPAPVKDYLDNCISRDPRWSELWPVEKDGVYLVTEDKWDGDEPPTSCKARYVGGNTGKSSRFCTRIGDLVADMHGFFYTTGHHSGGQSLWRWCNEVSRIPPGDLYLAWATAACAKDWCGPCAERYLFDRFPRSMDRGRSLGLLNKIRPP